MTYGGARGKRPPGASRSSRRQAEGPGAPPAAPAPQEASPRPPSRRLANSGLRLLRFLRAAGRRISAGFDAALRPLIEPSPAAGQVFVRAFLIALVMMIAMLVASSVVTEAWSPPRRDIEGRWGAVDAALPPAPPLSAAAAADRNWRIEGAEEPRLFLQQEDFEQEDQQESVNPSHPLPRRLEPSEEEQQQQQQQEMQQPVQQQPAEEAAPVSSTAAGNEEAVDNGEGPPAPSAVEVAVAVSSPALFAGQVGAESVEMMPDTEEQVAMLPNCMFYTSYMGSCIPETAHSPCRYCRAKQFTGQYGAAQCPSVLSFPAELQASYRWRITPVKIAKKDGYMDEHICVVEKVPGALPLSPEVYAAAAAGGQGGRDVTILWLVLGIIGITILLATVACLAVRSIFPATRAPPASRTRNRAA